MPDQARANIREITYCCERNDFVSDTVNRNGRSAVLPVAVCSATWSFTRLGVKV
jgi:hypothetical protein